MIRTFFIALAVLTMLALSFVASRPSRFRVEKKADTPATLQQVGELVGNLSKWPQWLPSLSPATNVHLTVNGDTGTFSGNAAAGEGTVTLTEKSATIVHATVSFERPSISTQTLHFELTPGTAGTAVTASIEGNLGFGEKFLSVAGIDATRAAATELENALNGLKTALERPTP
jgi:Polyketide cyclase / dehydrase and lipid transport